MPLPVTALSAGPLTFRAVRSAERALLICRERRVPPTDGADHVGSRSGRVVLTAAGGDDRASVHVVHRPFTGSSA